MKTFTETNLTAFDFWSGAKDNANELTTEQLEQIESIIEDLYPEGIDETQLNDLFWFDFDTVLEWIGLERCNKCGEIHEIGELCECEEDDNANN